MYVASIYLDVLHTIAVDFVLVKRPEEAAEAVDAREAESILGEQGTSIGLVVNTTASLENLYAELRSYSILKSCTSNNRVDDGFFCIEAMSIDHILDLIWKPNEGRLELEVLWRRD